MTHPSSEQAVKAYVDIVLDDCIVVRGLRLIRHSTDYLLAMPQTKRSGKGKPYDAAFPTTREGRRIIEDAVTEEYLKVMGTDHERQSGNHVTVLQALKLAAYVDSDAPCLEDDKDVGPFEASLESRLRPTK